MSTKTLPEPGWSEEIQAIVVKVTENWVIAVVPMIYNDRVTLSAHDGWEHGYTAGFCYDKGGAALLAAAVWDPETERNPAGFKKIACDARPKEN